MCKELNITSGEYFNEYFKKKYLKESIPFNEAMMSGKGDFNIFSDEFINIRIKDLNTTKSEYLNKLNAIIDLKNNINNYEKVYLYFGLDTFCQLNLLTLLAYIENCDYKGLVYLNIIDDYTNKVLNDNILVNLGIYKNIYDEIIVKRNNIQDLGVINKKAIDNYFDYLDENGYLSEIVKDNITKTDDEIIVILLAKSIDYGLSDLQALDLIKKIKNRL